MKKEDYELHIEPKLSVCDVEIPKEVVIEAGLPEWVLYHSAGDSIVTTVLTGIFGEMLGSDYEKTIKGVAQRISEEKKCSTR